MLVKRGGSSGFAAVMTTPEAFLTMSKSCDPGANSNTVPGWAVLRAVSIGVSEKPAPFTAPEVATAATEADGSGCEATTEAVGVAGFTVVGGVVVEAVREGRLAGA